ncbi:MAG: hypothetical protein HFH97_14985 [Lachnospiraceae bacterium]|jgi:hypothetical protein|nr:hypothetical protein [uncultured Acetatifactor sp.]MCI9230958.1 hypothetical protein [Lachnospiraceae bacterium]MCI9573886.1 hypothetical protein [Lachnospiraceae bacterium]
MAKAKEWQRENMAGQEKKKDLQMAGACVRIKRQETVAVDGQKERRTL